MGSHSQVLIDPVKSIVFKKIFDSDHFSLEVETTKAALTTAAKTGAFAVPQILAVDKRENVICFEYIPSLTPLSGLLEQAGSTESSTIMKRVGNALAAIHTGQMVNRKTIPIPIHFTNHSTQSYLHGDFNLANIQIDPATDRIVVLDWAFTPLGNQTGNWGPVYWDLAWMLNSIFTFPPFWGAGYRGRLSLADNFLKAYHSQTMELRDLNDFSAYCLNVFRLFVRKSLRQKLSTFLVFLPNRLQFARYALSLKKVNLGNE